MKFTEKQLQSISAPLGKTEDQQCQNAIGMVRDALKVLGYNDDGKAFAKMVDDTFAYQIELRNDVENRHVKIFVQGSYANNTSVRAESDVDIAVVEEDIFSPVYRAGVTESQYGFSTAPTRMRTFKDEVHTALENRFGDDVERQDKSIKIVGNTNRKDADSVPCRRYRDYSNDYFFNPDNYVGGVQIYPDSGGAIVNYPEQHIKNGRQKNVNTNRYYKKMVRIVKKIRLLMLDDRSTSASNMTSFGLESLLWNIPDGVFTQYSSIGLIFEGVADYLLQNTWSVSSYKEANGIKSLCPSAADVLNYKQFVLDLNKYIRV